MTMNRTIPIKPFPLVPTSSLYNVCLRSICHSIESFENVDSIDDIPFFRDPILPPSLMRDARCLLKHVWMYETPPPVNPNTFEYRDINLNSIDKFDFIQLMHHPNELHPEFWPSYWYFDAHVYCDYYTMSTGSNDSNPMLLCRPCFLKKSIPPGSDDIDFEHYWLTSGWTFHRKVKHYPSSPRQFVTRILKSSLRWCDWCLLTPLFQLYNGSSCEENTDIHLEEDSDSSDECVKLYKTERLYSPYHA